jgi:diadenosine tetraphosphate (Ap4A) HIT family hydrolase
MISTSSACPLCVDDGGLFVWRTPQWRVVRVLDAPEFPAFYRLVWNEHVAEFSDLSPAERDECMHRVVQIEQLLRRELAPTKINLATLGNVVPHLHWHVIARFDWDSHFPNPVWGTRLREPMPAAGERLLPAQLAALDAKLRDLLHTGS